MKHAVRSTYLYVIHDMQGPAVGNGDDPVSLCSHHHASSPCPHLHHSLRTECGQGTACQAAQGQPHGAGGGKKLDET